MATKKKGGKKAGGKDQLVEVSLKDLKKVTGGAINYEMEEGGLEAEGDYKQKDRAHKSKHTADGGGTVGGGGVLMG